MLIEFSVKNFRSIRELQSLSMVKGKGDELEATNTFAALNGNSIDLLSTSAIYGSNASGKSNFVRAISEMRSVILESASTQEGDQIDVTPFLFNEVSAEGPSEFEVIFISEGVQYQYGFSASRSKILEEWLIAYPRGRAQRWFSRVFDSETQTSKYKWSEFFTGPKTMWQKATRDNALFMSTAIQLNSDQLKPVFNWFRYFLRTASIGGWNVSYTMSECEKAEEKKQILEFLRCADFDIYDLKVTKEKFDPDLIPEEFPVSMRKELAENFEDQELIDMETIHKTIEGSLVPLSFSDESDGTQKFFSFAGPWLDSLRNGYILVIDELHDNLHPQLVKYLVQLFHNKETNPKNAQLIFTTHETSILNQDVFRRDQVWFCNKNKAQETNLYPLTEFKPRKGRENLELGYLSGRYGAVPLTSQFHPE